MGRGYTVSQGESTKLRESVTYVKLYRYNPKHLYPKLNGYGDNGHRKVWSSCVFHAIYLLRDVIVNSPHSPSIRRPTRQLRLTLSLINVVSLCIFIPAVSDLSGACKKCLFRFLTWNIVTCISCVDSAMAVHELLLNTEGVFPTEGFRVHWFLLVLTRHCVTAAVFQV